MSDLNSVVLVGRLTRDPELRYLPQGAPVCELTLASNRRYSKKDGEKVEEVIFVDVVAWNRLAEICAEFLLKGRQVVVAGSLVQERWDDKDTGQKRSKIRIQAQTLQFLGGGREDAETPDAESASHSEEPLVVPEVPVAPAPQAPAPLPPVPASYGRPAAAKLRTAARR